MWPNVLDSPGQIQAGKFKWYHGMVLHDPARVSPADSNMIKYAYDTAYVLLIVKQIQTAEVETLMHCSALVYYNSSPFEVVEL